jgi:flagellar hook-associated protein 1 FlgK
VVPPISDVPFDPALTYTYGEKQDALAVAHKRIAEMKPEGYQLRYENGDWRILNPNTLDEYRRSPDGPVVSQDGFLYLHGLRFDVNSVGIPEEGDRFVVKPHQDILNNFDAVITQGERLATRGQNPLPDGGQPLDRNSTAEPGGEGDNVNIANIASLQSKKVLFSKTPNGEATETILGGYSRMSGSVGMYVRSSEIQHDAQKNTFNYIMERRESQSGVSLDEEAANLLKYQQAYQAAAQVMQISQTLFQTLIGSFR